MNTPDHFGLPEQSGPLTYSVKESAERIGVSYQTLLRLLKRGKLRAIASLRHKQIPASELTRFLKDDLS